MNFIDKTEILVRSGAGGNGLVSFRAGPAMPKMGVDGGDGGDGGDVFLVGNEGIKSLSCVLYKKLYKAEHGAKGGPNGRTGRAGESLNLPVPLGTIITGEEGEILGEVTRHNEKVLVAKGGYHGLGNMRFLSSRHQAPEESTEGGEAVEKVLNLELKLIADIGFAGFPNAGKSTLLSTISRARPKIADYPFTTLSPQLGVVELDAETYGWGKSFVAADIPGLIEGASQGKGLGFQFLRHLERTHTIAYVLDTLNPNLTPFEQYLALRVELNTFNDSFLHKKAFAILTKKDACQDEELVKKSMAQFEKHGIKCMFVSSVAHENIETLKGELFSFIEAAPEAKNPVKETKETRFKDSSEYRFLN